MIKDIVVSLQPGEDGGPAGDYAVSLASTFEAHVAGIAFVYTGDHSGIGRRLHSAGGH